jgi:hypothetical protein
MDTNEKDERIGELEDEVAGLIKRIEELESELASATERADGLYAAIDHIDDLTAAARRDFRS